MLWLSYTAHAVLSNGNQMVFWLTSYDNIMYLDNPHIPFTLTAHWGLMWYDGNSADKVPVQNSLSPFHINVLRNFLGSPMLQIVDRELWLLQLKFEITLGFF